MPLQPGERLGPYEVVVAIGAGGMGEVYKARDTRLDRTVAIKVNKAEFTERFEREARAVAALNHPNICQLYDAGANYLVMELVDGRPLKGPLRLSEALKFAVQIADAVAAAHSAGIVHRDLKPANILVTPKGSVKVLDFGLAKLTEPAEGASDTTRTALAETAEGTVVGTVAYMSPEQAEGRQVDARSDIFSFGSVLYELVTGRRAFEGPTAISTLSAILHLEPKPIEGVSPDLEKIIRRCLRKDPDMRFQHMSDVAVLLRELQLEPAAAQPAGEFQRRPRPYRLALAGALLVVASVMATYFIVRRPPTPVGALRKFRVDIEADIGSLNFFDTALRPILSPDGTKVAYTRAGKLWIHDLTQLGARPLPGTENALGPFWSPDSNEVAFQAGSVLKKVDLRSGALKTIGELPRAGNYLGGSWGESGSILVGIVERGLYEVPAQGGNLKLVLAPDHSKGEFDFHSPHYLPGGRDYLYVLHPRIDYKLSVWVRSGRTSRRVTEESAGVAGSAVYDRQGFVLYERLQGNRSIFALPFSPSAAQKTGEPFVVAEAALGPSVSKDGALLSISGGTARPHELVMVDRSGKIVQVLGQAFDSIRHPTFSPDNTRIGFAAMEEGNWDVRVYDLVRKTTVRISDAPETEFDFAWSPTGDSIAFSSGGLSSARRIVERRSDGTDVARPLVSDGQTVAFPAWGPDGKNLVYVVQNAGEKPQIWIQPLSGDAPPRPLISTSSAATTPTVAFDGRHIAYVSDESGRNEVYVRPFPSGEGRWLVSTSGGYSPRWNRRGDELFYLEGNNLMVVPVETEPTFRAGAPKKVFGGDEAGVMLYSWFPFYRAYDISPDGQYVITMRPVGGVSKDAVTIVQNWLSEFRK